MKMTLVFVPPGGGEADYQLQFDLPSVPQPGDYISIKREDELGCETFIVRRTIWDLTYPKGDGPTAREGEHGKPRTVWVECEFARGAYMTDAHKRCCDGHEARGLTVPEHEATAY